MCNNKATINMGFTDEEFPEGTHMCLIYSDEEERKEIISKFIDGGHSSGEKVAYFADEMSHEEVKSWLIEKGFKTTKESKKDSFTVTAAAEIYHPDGRFHPDKMIEKLKSLYKKAMDEGYPAIRVTGEMAWALKGIQGSERLMEYEAKINEITDEYPITPICQYDANKFDGATILQCLKVHPYMIVHGQIVRNPYYMKTEDFLEEQKQINNLWRMFLI